MKDAPRPAYLEIDGEIGTITLNRPEAYNAIDLEMAVRLKELAFEAEATANLKVLIIRGEGAAFCGGGDIRHFVSNLDDIDTCIRNLLGPYHEFLMRLRSMPKVVLASVHGSVAGAGLSLASMCDFGVASDDCVFTPAYAKIGVSPDGGGTWGLVRAVGERRALQIYLAEDSFTAEQAVQWGLVTRLVPADRLADETRSLAKRIARTSADALAGTKRLIAASTTAVLPGHLNNEMETLIGCMASDEFVSAVSQFVRKP